MADPGQKLHWLAGFILGAASRPLPRHLRVAVCVKLGAWAFAREMRQNQAGQNPNPQLSDKQRAEAEAWGNGFRVSSGLSGPG